MKYFWAGFEKRAGKITDALKAVGENTPAIRLAMAKKLKEARKYLKADKDYHGGQLMWLNPRDAGTMDRKTPRSLKGIFLDGYPHPKFGDMPKDFGFVHEAPLTMSAQRRGFPLHLKTNYPKG